MATDDARIVLRGAPFGEVDDPIVDHSGQPADYHHIDGTVWTWQDRWRVVRGIRLRLYDLLADGTDSS
jgi:hypothetical protein